MSKRTGRALVAAVAVFGAMQLVRPSMTNPPTDTGRTIQAQLPEASRMAGVINRSCRDCHTNETRWPWYSRVAPVSWLLGHDVVDGREAVNFSEWTTYNPERQRKLLQKSCEEVTDGEMPIRSYTWLHPDTKLSPQDVDAICAVTRNAAPSQ